MRTRRSLRSTRRGLCSDSTTDSANSRAVFAASSARRTRSTSIKNNTAPWMRLSAVRPCRTADNRIQGAVLFLIDVDRVRRAELAANTAREFAESVVESLQRPLLVLRSDLRVRMANPAFFESYKL